MRRITQLSKLGFVLLFALSACTSQDINPTNPPSPSKTFIPSPPKTLIPTTVLPTATSTRIPTKTPAPITNKTMAGHIESDETWAGNIVVTGDIWVHEGVTLTIESGTKITLTAQQDSRHAGGDKDVREFPDDPPKVPANMISIMAMGGKIIAHGTSENPIIFTSNSDTPAVNDWGGFGIHNGFIDFDYVIVEYSYLGLSINEPFTDVSSINVTNTIFRHIASCGFCTGGRQIPPFFVISNNQFIDCRHEGVNVQGVQNLIIQHNLFVDNYAAVNLNKGGSALVENNTFIGNTFGANVHHGSSATIRNNEFLQNKETAVAFRQDSGGVVENNNFEKNAMNIMVDRSTLDIAATGNWWGTTDRELIESLIWDKKDETKDGLVTYDPFASEFLVLDVPK